MKRIILGIVALLLCFATWLHTESNTPKEIEVQSITAQIIEVTPTPIVTPQPTQTPIPTPELPQYDIPLDKDLQQYIYDLCKAEGVHYDVAIGVIKTESNFQADLICTNTNGTKDFGLMQVNTINHKWLSKELGITDFLDPYQNVKAGLHILSIAYKNSNNVDEALMEFNMGRNTVNKLLNRGITSSVYSRTVLQNKEIIKESINNE